MKRLLIVLSLIICLSLASVYIFIPENLTVSKTAFVNRNSNAVYRTLIQTNNWRRLLGSEDGLRALKIENTGNSFFYKNETFQINGKFLNSVGILIYDGNTRFNGELSIFQLNTDSAVIQWRGQLSSGRNPWQRIEDYLAAVRVKNNMADILSKLTAFLEKNENIYGISIHEASTNDTSLIATKSRFNTYPNVSDIYRLVTRLQEYASKKGALQTDVPLLNITKSDSGLYQVMVALPTNVKLTDEGQVFFRRMVAGNFLVSEVKGGDYTINEGFENLRLYISDYKKTAMAIPFQFLVTDRTKQPDTSKWITKLYYPINY